MYSRLAGTVLYIAKDVCLLLQSARITYTYMMQYWGLNPGLHVNKAGNFRAHYMYLTHEIRL